MAIKTLPPKLVKTMLLSVILLLCGNPVADMLGLKYWQPIIRKPVVRVFAYQNVGVPADVVFFGSSRSQSALWPTKTEDELRSSTGTEISTFSLAQPGVNLLAAEWIFNDVISSDDPPTLVLLEVTPSSVNANREFYWDMEWYGSTSDLATVALHLRSTGRILSATRGMLRGWSSVASWILHAPSSQEAQNTIHRILENRGRGETTSHSLLDLTPERRARNLVAQRQSQRTNVLKNYSVGGVPVTALNKIIDRCERIGCRVAMYNPPVHESFLDLFHDGVSDEFGDFLSGIRERHGIHFYDFSTEESLVRLGLSDADFRDFSHLNEAGSEKFSRALARDVLTIELGHRAAYCPGANKH